MFSEHVLWSSLGAGRLSIITRCSWNMCFSFSAMLDYFLDCRYAR